MTFRMRSRSRRAVRISAAVVVAVGVSLATTSCTPAVTRYLASASAVRTPSAHRPRVRSSRTIAHALVAKINAERRNRGLRELHTNELLARYAAHWGRHLIATRQFRHQNLARIIIASHYRLAEVGENLFRGSGRGADDAGTAHLALMHSTSHRANILLPQAQVVGIAALCVGRKLMVVEEFGIRSGAALPPSGQRVASVQPLIAKNAAGPSC
jgi:uncharacterized protein YkwD